MTTRKELIEAVGARYRRASISERSGILDEFVAVTGYHRKHAIRVLGSAPSDGSSTRSRNRLCDEAVRQALIVPWEAGDRVCGKRLKALVPVLINAIERHGHLQPDPVVKAKLLEVSAATIDRTLGEARSRVAGQRKRRTGVGAAIRRSIPVRTFSDWRDPPPGFFEVDMVEHCGGAKTDGDFASTSATPCSFRAGTSGGRLERLADATPSTRSLPALTCGSTASAGRLAICASPAMMASTAWLEPANGTWTMSVPHWSATSSIARCDSEPLPIEER